MFLPEGTLPPFARRFSSLFLPAVLVIAAFFVAAIPTTEAAVSTDSLVGYWKFDEGTGTFAADSSGHGKNGTLTGGPTWSASPTNTITFTNPYALSFDGTDDQIDLALTSPNTPPMTLSAWMKMDSTSFVGNVVGLGSI